jgi:uncharacterized FlaG/YvyC family protein
MVSTINTTAISAYQGNGVAYDRTPIHSGKSNSPLSSRGNRVDLFQERKRDVAQGVREGIDSFFITGDLRLEFERSEETGDIMVKVIQKRTGRLIREIPAKLISDVPGIIDETV